MHGLIAVKSATASPGQFLFMSQPIVRDRQRGAEATLAWAGQRIVYALLLLHSLCPAVCAAAAPPTSASGTTATQVLEVFVRDGCPHCTEAKAFLDELAAERPSLRIVVRRVDLEPSAAHELSRLSRAAGVWPPGVPTFVYGDAVLVGFGGAVTSGAALRAVLDQAPVNASDGGVDTALGVVSAERLGLPLFALVLGLIDGFNPCAIWVLMFLLSLLVHLRDRRRMALIAGTFVLVSGAVYFAFMSAWLNVFLAVGLSEPLRLALASLAMFIGLVNVKDFLAWGRGLSIGIPAAAKPGIYSRMRRVVQAPVLPAALGGVAALAVVVNLVELLCTAGIPAVFTAVLAQQALAPLAHYAYLLLYIFGYITDDTLMVGTAVMALGSRRLGERGARVLKLLSGSVMLVLGAVLFLRPDWLY